MIMQHYGLKSSLIDVTLEKEIAEYFACSGKYKDNGYIYTFEESEMKNVDTKTVKWLMDILWNKETWIDNNKTLNKRYCFDYSRLFKTQVDNIRYQRQKGRFILHNYELVDNKWIPLFVDYPKEYIEIKCEDKIKSLLRLALKKHITRVYLFPDKDDSVLLTLETLTKNKKMGEDIEKLFKDYKSENWQNMIKVLLSSDDGYYFLKTDFVDYCKELVNTDNYDDIAVKVLECIKEIKGGGASCQSSL